MMDEMMFFRLFGGSLFGSAIDLTAVLAFLGFAVIYVIAPVLGYQEDRRGGILGALYLLFFYAALSLIQLLVQWVVLLDGSLGPGMLAQGGPGGAHLLILFSVLKLVMFLAALLVFLNGLRALRLGASFYDLRAKPRDQLTAEDFRRRDV
jgi:hypothetical protein